MIVRADNADLNVAECIKEYMDHNSLKRAPHPPYSPDLASSDFPDLNMSNTNYRDVNSQKEQNLFGASEKL
jgi:hypothetical protein